VNGQADEEALCGLFAAEKTHDAGMGGLLGQDQAPEAWASFGEAMQAELRFE
jgi:hypothetical protein